MPGRNGKTCHLSARVPRRLVKDLEGFASRQRMTTSAALVRILDESLRMARHPGIDFRTRPLGRSAFVTGTGLAVWEVYMIWRDYKRNTRRMLRAYSHLTPGQVEAALRYFNTYPEEIKAELDEAAPDDALAKFPFLRVVKA